MLAQSHARKPAPPLAARGMWLRLHGGADAFGSALGDAVVGSIAKGDGQKAPQKQEPEYQSKPLTQADIDGFLAGTDDDRYSDGGRAFDKALKASRLPPDAQARKNWDAAIALADAEVEIRSVLDREENLQAQHARADAYRKELNAQTAASKTTNAAASATRFGDEIAPLADLRGTVRGISGSAEAKDVAADFQRRAAVLMRSADQVQASNAEMAQAYRRAAGNYVMAGGEATRAGSSFINGASLPKPFVNPPEFQVSAGWSHMGQNNVGKPVQPFDYVSVNLGFYVGGGGVSVNLHDGEFFGQWALGRSYPAYGMTPSLTVTAGNIINGYGARDTAAFLTGPSAQAGAFVPLPVAPIIGIGGGLNHSYGGKTAVEFGISLPSGGKSSGSIAPVGYGWKGDKEE